MARNRKAWMRKYRPDSRFVWTRLQHWRGTEYGRGDEVPDDLRLDATRRREFWIAGLMDFDYDQEGYDQRQPMRAAPAPEKPETQQPDKSAGSPETSAQDASTPPVEQEGADG